MRIASILVVGGLFLVSCENGQHQSTTQSSPIGPQVTIKEIGVSQQNVGVFPRQLRRASRAE